MPWDSGSWNSIRLHVVFITSGCISARILAISIFLSDPRRPFLKYEANRQGRRSRVDLLLVPFSSVAPPRHLCCDRRPNDPDQDPRRNIHVFVEIAAQTRNHFRLRDKLLTGSIASRGSLHPETPISSTT
jgi:hypothetical protein